MTVLHPLGRRALLVAGSTGVGLARSFLASDHTNGDITAAGSIGAASTRRLLVGGCSEEDSLSAGTATVYIFVCIGLVAASGLAAGLTLGLLSLDRVDIEVIKRTGSAKHQKLARRVEPILSNPHYLMVSLLLCNAAAYEALPIFLDRLLNPVAAILISVSAILIFGEILPQAVCKRYGLHIGAYLSWLVRFVMFVTAPISWPLGKLLDWMLGEETVLFRRQELRALVTLHAEPEDGGGESMLTLEEMKVIHGALDMTHKTAQVAMTPLEKVNAVAADAIVDRQLVRSIVSCGHSRVPVYEGTDKRNIIGLLLVKELVLVDFDQGKRVRECGASIRQTDALRADTPLYVVMEYFRLKRRHMAVITRAPPADEVAGGLARTGSGSTGAIEMVPVAPGQGIATTDASTASKSSHQGGSAVAGPEADVIGVITIEDVIEELLQHEIIDETDRFVDNLQTQAVVATPGLPPKLTKYLTKGRKVALAPATLPRHPSAPGPDAVAAGAAAAVYAAARAAGRDSPTPSRRSASASTLHSVAPEAGADPLLPGRHVQPGQRPDSS